jgi:hypothetical protein
LLVVVVVLYKTKQALLLEMDLVFLVAVTDCNSTLVAVPQRTTTVAVEVVETVLELVVLGFKESLLLDMQHQPLLGTQFLAVQ